MIAILIIATVTMIAILKNTRRRMAVGRREFHEGIQAQTAASAQAGGR